MLKDQLCPDRAEELLRAMPLEKGYERMKIIALTVLSAFFLCGCGENSPGSREMIEDLTGASNVARYETVKSRIGGIDAENKERIRDSE